MLHLYNYNSVFDYTCVFNQFDKGSIRITADERNATQRCLIAPQMPVPKESFYFFSLRLY